MAEDSRACSECKETKLLTEFRLALKRGKYQPRAKCRACEAKAASERFQANSASYASRTKEYRQAEKRRAAERAGRPYRTAEEIASPENQAAVADRAMAQRKAYERAHRKENAARQKEREIARRKARLAEYRAAHPELSHYECASQAEFDAFRIGASPWILLKTDADQYKARYELDDEFREKETQRSRERREQLGRMAWFAQTDIRQAFKHNKSPRWLEECLGYTLAELRSHIEVKLSNSMTWQMYLDGFVVIDHIKPSRLFDMKDPEGFRACWALTNLQPLWTQDNVRKGGKYASDE